MFENRISAMPVADQRRRCKGVLSTTDLIALSYRESMASSEPAELDRLAAELTDASRTAANLGQRKVADVMTTDVVTVTNEDTIHVAAREMLRNRVHRLVVVDQQQRVIGILSTMDLLEAFAAQAEVDA
jgi:CBS domain-containing protein